MRVTRIFAVGVDNVYNMEVEDTHDFAVNTGVVVHNCYDESRYLLMENPISPRQNVADVIPMSDPLNQYKRKNAF